RVEQPFDYQTEHATPEAFGGAVGAAEQRAGQQTEQAGSNVAQIAIIKQQRQNDIAINQGWNDFQQFSYDQTYGPDGIYAKKGKAAMDAAPAALDAINSYRSQIYNNLQNDAQRLQFDQQSRRLQMFTADTIGRHVDQQSDVYALALANAGEDNTIRSIATNYNDERAYRNSMVELGANVHDRIRASYGPDAAPALVNAELSRATSRAVAARAEAWGANDPAGALTWLKAQANDIDPVVYSRLVHSLQPRADGDYVDDSIERLSNGQPLKPYDVPSVGGSATVPGLAGAITGQEGSGPNSVSPAGARGTRQVTPTFFQHYAQPGEDFNKEADRVAVSDRGIADLSQKYNGDAGRVAVAYFSGEGNVAPPGSPTPWIQNRTDGRTSVSDYVAGVERRLGATPAPANQNTPPVSPPTPSLAPGQARDQAIPGRYFDEMKMLQNAYEQTAGLSEKLQKRIRDGLYERFSQINTLENGADAKADRALKNFQTDNEAQLIGFAAQGQVIGDKD
ncbi:MAG: hypothetical protein WAN65_12205, partial [Candidatus Sulfotelmatobacter sp.]